MQKKKNLNLEITELFMAKADWNRCFHGIIKRGIDLDGNPYVFGKIKVKSVHVCARATDQWILGAMLDEMCIMVLDKGLLTDSGVFTEILGDKYFSN